MPYELAPLPYDYEALAPHISADTLRFHHDKHHAGYVTNYNKMVEGTEYADQAIEDVIRAIAGDSSKSGIFNNAAQAWNHTFYWNSLKPNGAQPTGALADKINQDFGSLDKLKEELKTAGTTQFGSGWAWLVLDNNTLKVTKTLNADNPLTHGQVPLLTIDVWEHAYYLDYQNRRPDYEQAVLDNLINWEFAAANLSAA